MRCRAGREQRREWRRERALVCVVHEPGADEDGADALVALESQQQEEGVKLLPREHESDRKKDVKSLDRQGQRNVYLLVQVNEAGKKSWRFPHVPVTTRENLFEVRSIL